MMVLVWFLDSGVSFHMTGDKYFFTDLDEKDLGVLDLLHAKEERDILKVL